MICHNFCFYDHLLSTASLHSTDQSSAFRHEFRIQIFITSHIIFTTQSQHIISLYHSDPDLKRFVETQMNQCFFSTDTISFRTFRASLKNQSQLRRDFVSWRPTSSASEVHNKLEKHIIYTYVYIYIYIYIYIYNIPSWFMSRISVILSQFSWPASFVHFFIFVIRDRDETILRHHVVSEIFISHTVYFPIRVSVVVILQSPSLFLNIIQCVTRFPFPISWFSTSTKNRITSSSLPIIFWLRSTWIWTDRVVS